MRKIIKKILNLFGWLALVISLAGIILSILLNTPKIQDNITRRILEKLEEQLGNTISFSIIRIHIFNKIDFDNLLITDNEKDTIVFAPKLQAGIPGLIQKIIFQKELPLRLGSLSFEDSYFRLYTNEKGVLNIQFIVDRLAAKSDSSGAAKPTYVDRIKVKNSRFALVNSESSGKDFGVDFSNLILTNLNFKIKDLKILADTVQMDVENLSFIEKSGFEIRKFSSMLNLCNTHLHFDATNIQTLHSNLSFNTIYFNFTNFRDFRIDKLYKKVNLSIDCIKSTIYLNELGYFARVFEDMDNTIYFSGIV